MSWWEKEQLRISAVQYKSETTESDVIFDEYVSKAGFNIEQNVHLLTVGFIGSYIESEHGKKLDEYLKKTKKAGVREIIYTNIHCMNEELCREHPEFKLLDKDKEPIMAYNGTYNFLCINGPYFQEHLKNIRGLCSHDIDGIFLDGPIMRPDACYCEHCLKKFEEMYGKSRYEATYFESAEFNMKMATEFVKATNEEVKKINPEILLYINNTLLKPDIVGVRGRETAPYLDIVGTEGGFVWVDKSTTLWHVSPLVKMAETIAYGKQRVCFIAGDCKPWSYHMHTPCETDILYGQTLAYGANIWYGLHGGYVQGSTPSGKAAEAFNRFMEENADNLLGTKSTSKVALFWSDATATRYATSVDETDFIQSAVETGEDEQLKGNQFTSFKGMYDILTRGHIQFDLVDEESFKRDECSGYDLIILTTAACMSDEVAEKIREYVKNGGKIIATFDTGLYDETCKQREDFILSDVFGASFKTVHQYDPGCGYQIVNSENPLFDGIFEENIPMPLLSVETKPKDGAKTFGYARMPMQGRYLHIEKETYPSVIYNKFGKGECLYIGAAVGEFFDKYGNADWKKIILSSVKGFSAPVIETDAPGSVEVSLRKKEGKLLLHLINVTGEMIRPIERIIPLNNISFKLNGIANVKSVKTLRGKENLKFGNSDSLTFTLPQLNNHEIIEIIL